MTDSTGRQSLLIWASRIASFLMLLYLFLVGIKILETAIKTVGKDATDQLIQGVTNPFAALAVGILATVLVQSSSATTASIVTLVGTGVLPIEIAVPMILGANIGTSVTSTLVSLGHMTQSEEFRRAYAGATVHDFFNLITVAIMLPIELITKKFFGTGFLAYTAAQVTQFLPQDVEGEKSKSVIKIAIGWSAKKIQWVFAEGLALEKVWLAVALFLVAAVMILGTLYMLTKTMKLLMAGRIERWLNLALKKSVLVGWVVGIVITVLVQSSSITSSLLVPMFGAGILALEAGFPILVGANIGTTITALLASLVSTEDRQSAMTIAVVHLLFNCIGSALFLPIPKMRRIPIRAAEWLAGKAVTNKLWVVGYLLCVFVLLPFLGYFLWN